MHSMIVFQDHNRPFPCSLSSFTFYEHYPTTKNMYFFIQEMIRTLHATLWPLSRFQSEQCILTFQLGFYFRFYPTTNASNCSLYILSFGLYISSQLFCEVLEATQHPKQKNTCKIFVDLDVLKI